MAGQGYANSQGGQRIEEWFLIGKDQQSKPSIVYESVMWFKLFPKGLLMAMQITDYGVF